MSSSRHRFISAALSLLSFLISWTAGLDVKIDYSFRVPEKFGATSVSSAGCCPHIQLPDNNTEGMVAPFLIGIGVEKAGTWLLYMQLKIHPELHHPDKKELYYLDEFTKSYQEYLRQWEWNRNGEDRRSNSTNGAYAIDPPKSGGLFEITPSYLFVPIAACKAKVVTPNAKFVVLLREPASRAYSGYVHNWNYENNKNSWRQWMNDYWITVRDGLKWIALNTKCDFQTGRGLYTYNDCAGCLAIVHRAAAVCDGRHWAHVALPNGDTSCNLYGTEIIFRGLYAPSLSWWFTLFDPSQFRIYNSADYFSDSHSILKDITSFLELSTEYSEEMFRTVQKIVNVGSYNESNKANVELATSVLRDFYQRPNLELYKLLRDTGHTEFTPFDESLAEKDTLDCRDPGEIYSGICGDPRLYSYTNDDGELKIPLPQNILQHVMFTEIELTYLRQSMRETASREQQLPEGRATDEPGDHANEFSAKGWSMSADGGGPTIIASPEPFRSENVAYWSNALTTYKLLCLLLFAIVFAFLALRVFKSKDTRKLGARRGHRSDRYAREI